MNVRSVTRFLPTQEEVLFHDDFASVSLTVTDLLVC